LAFYCQNLNITGSKLAETSRNHGETGKNWQKQDNTGLKLVETSNNQGRNWQKLAENQVETGRNWLKLAKTG
jgi:hypothetical protein